jgi:hypothetical protein
MKWLTKIFPRLSGKKLHPQFVLDLPPWDEQDAERLLMFLESHTGSRLIDTLRHSVTAMALTTDDLSEKERADRRSLAFVLEGIETMADVDYWRFNARK